MKLILVRHGETKANVDKLYSGWTDFPLTDRGKEQVKNLLEILSRENIDVIYSSPLSRTLVTAEIISKHIGKKFYVNEKLKEMNFGIFEGKTYKEISKTYHLEWEKWISDNIKYRIPNGESLIDMYNRVTQFIDELKDKDGTFLLVTHAGVIRIAITYLLNLNIDEMWHFKILPGGLVEILYENDFGVLTKLV
ncbi:alpha-ribazole phosphatase [Caloranaerobacter azorensis DSM 13643]|uniref:Alpha-ribazole phosphatase n=1 Tax=Caloranaerobacter azorensis DSM 13643 TaxID=1121264 RepID=A0A1M5R8Q9_9FIRM|nr:alpha-ribazole phosphatase [Caloranaerobacter azorensis]SHH22715.1 alpha-ribazole phosphatase [Caloranaerobacter azorensis DSM 13643]